MRSRVHFHSCGNKSFGCLAKVECYDAFLERNVDGFPEIICSYNQEETLLCNDCEDTETCEDCGAPEHLAHDLKCSFWERVYPYDDPEWDECDPVPIEAYTDLDYRQEDRRVQ